MFCIFVFGRAALFLSVFRQDDEMVSFSFYVTQSQSGLADVGVLQDCLCSRTERHGPAGNARLAPRSTHSKMLVWSHSQPQGLHLSFLVLRIKCVTICKNL